MDKKSMDQRFVHNRKLADFDDQPARKHDIKVYKTVREVVDIRSPLKQFLTKATCYVFSSNILIIERNLTLKHSKENSKNIFEVAYFAKSSLRTERMLNP